MTTTLTAERAEQAKLSRLLDRTEAFIRKYVALGHHESTALTGWVAHTWCLSAAYVTPYIFVTSATPASGKTRLLECLSLIVAKPLMTGSISAAALMRTCDAEEPTILLDESDASFGGDREYAEALRGLLNTGYTRSGRATRLVPQGNQWVTKQFKTWSPKCLAGIGDHLPDTLRTRSIVIRLKRKKADEPVARFFLRDATAEAAELGASWPGWAAHNVADLEHDRPTAAAGLTDRAEELWTPIFAIFDRSGSVWATRGRDAATALSGSANAPDDDINIELLRDIHMVWANDIPFISTQNLLSDLHASEERPLNTWSRGQPMTARALSLRLELFGIYSRSTGAVRGYDRDRFLDAWSRYKVGPPPKEASNCQAPNEVGAGVIDALTVHAGDRGHLREWTLVEIDAMEKRSQLLRPDYLDRLRRLSDRSSQR